jgi:hypothetical protein
MNPPAKATLSFPSPGDRLQRRRRLLWWSLLPVVLVLCLAAKMLSVGVLGGNAGGAFGAGDSRAVAEAAAGLRFANFTEPHKAPFAEGDGLFLAGDYAGARRSFEEALDLAGQADQCAVRVNLALSIERLGDAKASAGDPAAAGRLFAEALAVVEAAPDGCFNPGAEAGGGVDSTEAGTADKLKQAAARCRRDPHGRIGKESRAGRSAGRTGKPEPARPTQGQYPRGPERAEYGAATG